MKTTLGNATDAGNAAAIVSRCMTAIGALTPGTDFRNYGHSSIPATPENETYQPLAGWKQHIDADPQVSGWTFAGMYSHTVALRKTSTGTVYRVSRLNPSAGAYEQARDHLNALSGPWLLDYWPYDTQKVIATANYVPLLPSATNAQATGDASSPDYMKRVWGESANYQAMRTAGLNPTAQDVASVGGSLIYLGY